MTNPSRPPPTVAVIGAGRAGRALALALTRAGVPVRVLTRRPTTLPAGVTGTTEPWRVALAGVDTILVAVPDDAIGDVATRLREAELAGTVVLHCSGFRDRSALDPIEGRARGLGSFHPLQTLAGDSDAAARLRAAFVALEGDEHALGTGRDLARILDMRAIELEGRHKVLYHAGAVLLSNYTVALAAIAERLALQAGVPRDAAGRIYLPLLEGTLRNLESGGVVSALTGPIRRGDIGTVRAHLVALDPALRPLYAELGLEAVALARRGGLREERAVELEALFRLTIAR